MSLDVYLEPSIVLDDSESDPHLFWANITHNLGSMANKAGLYLPLWRPEEIDVNRAHQLIPLLEEGLTKLKASPEDFKELNPENGWGSYEGLVSFVERYLAACREYPDSFIYISR